MVATVNSVPLQTAAIRHGGFFLLSVYEEEGRLVQDVGRAQQPSGDGSQCYQQ
jgi:hypothetical protein